MAMSLARMLTTASWHGQSQRWLLVALLLVLAAVVIWALASLAVRLCADQGSAESMESLAARVRSAFANYSNPLWGAPGYVPWIEDLRNGDYSADSTGSGFWLGSWCFSPERQAMVNCSALSDRHGMSCEVALDVSSDPVRITGVRLYRLPRDADGRTRGLPGHVPAVRTEH